MPETKKEKARRLIEELRFDDALGLWREICVDGPPNASDLVEKALCLVELGAEAEAVFELETAIALEPEIRSRIEDDWRFSNIVCELN